MQTGFRRLTQIGNTKAWHERRLAFGSSQLHNSYLYFSPLVYIGGFHIFTVRGYLSVNQHDSFPCQTRMFR